MRYEIIFAPEAVADLRALKAYVNCRARGYRGSSETSTDANQQESNQTPAGFIQAAVSTPGR